MGLIFIRDDELHIDIKAKRKFKPQNSWASLMKCMKSRKAPTGSSADRRQRVYFNMKYSSVNTACGKKLARAHLDYISRHGTGEDSRDPEIYGNITGQQLLDIKPGEQHHFRFIVSPERLGDIDLKVFIESYMRYLSAATGYQLQWVAANHYNTAHPHAHIIIKGVDGNAKKIRFTRYQVQYRFRSIAQDFLTFLLGERTLDQEKAAADAGSTRYTSLDKTLEGVTGGSGILPHSHIGKIFRPVDVERIRQRLVFLASINLVTCSRAGYHFTPGWSNILKQIGRCDDCMAALKSIKYNRLSQTIQFDRKQHKSVCGIVSFIGKKDELMDNNFMLVEALDGKNYICDISQFAAFKVNDVVAFDTQKFRLFRTVGEMESLLKGNPESPLKRQITRLILDQQKEYR